MRQRGSKTPVSGWKKGRRRDQTQMRKELVSGMEASLPEKKAVQRLRTSQGISRLPVSGQKNRRRDRTQMRKELVPGMKAGLPGKKAAQSRRTSQGISRLPVSGQKKDRRRNRTRRMPEPVLGGRQPLGGR